MTTDDGLLALLVEDMAGAAACYRPTRYWQALWASGQEHLSRPGAVDFEGVPAMSPRYADPTGAEPERDYAAFRWADHTAREPFLAEFSETRTGDHLGRYVEFDGRVYTKGALKYLRALAWAKNHLPPGVRVRRVLELGGGYGILGEILLRSGPAARYVDVDLPHGAFAAGGHLRRVFGPEAVLDYRSTRTATRLDAEGLLRGARRALVIPPWQLPALTGQFDLVAVVKAFQEMEPPVIRNYTALLTAGRPAAVLLVNRSAGGNVLAEPDRPGVDRPVPMDELIGMFEGYRPAGRLCPPFSDGGQEVALLTLAEPG